jgi:periplasmic protein TonB
MAYADQEMSTRRVLAIGAVALLHAGVGYALVTGLAFDAAKKVYEDIQSINLTPDAPPEEPPPPPKDTPPPPPPQVNPPPRPVNAPIPPSPVPPAPRPTPTPSPVPTPAPVPVPVPVPVPRPVPAPVPVPAPPPAKAVRASPKGSPGSWATTDDYPSSAIRAEESGTTSFSVQIGPDGRVTSCSVTGSSGSSSLDDATCRLVQRRARFSPAKNTAGEAVSDSYSNRVRWFLPK